MTNQEQAAVECLTFLRGAGELLSKAAGTSAPLSADQRRKLFDVAEGVRHLTNSVWDDVVTPMNPEG